MSKKSIILRTLFSALFLISMICLASCNRNWCATYSPRNIHCTPNCGTCSPWTNECELYVQPNDAPCPSWENGYEAYIEPNYAPCSPWTNECDSCVEPSCAPCQLDQPAITVTESGPDWAYICKVVDYTITVTNPGDSILNNIIVEDVSPPATSIVDAPDAEISCDNRAIWTIPQLCPGETMTFTLSQRSRFPGCLTNRVTVSYSSDCGSCTSCAEATTYWRGIPAVHMCMIDTIDPICIGDTTTYHVCISNLGSAEDTNVRLAIKFTNELQPVDTNGPTCANISGQTVEFAPIACLAPKQYVEFDVTVQGVSAGDARAEAILGSDALCAPVIDIEATHVY